MLEVEHINCSREELRTRVVLEVADTLCNLGWLYLGKMSLQPGFPKYGNDAEHAFAEALETFTPLSWDRLIHSWYKFSNYWKLSSPGPEISLTGSPFSKSSRSMKKFPPGPEIPLFDLKNRLTCCLSPIPSSSLRSIESSRRKSLVLTPIPELDTRTTTPSNRALNDTNLSEFRPWMQLRCLLTS